MKADSQNTQQNKEQEQLQPKEKMMPYNPGTLAPEEEDYYIPRQRNKSGGMDGIKAILVNGIMALVLIFAMNSIIMPTVGKKVYQADITRLETDMVAMRNTEGELSKRIAVLETNQDVAIADITAKAKETETVLTGKVTELSNGVNNRLNSFVTNDSLNNQISSVKSNVSALDGRVSAAVSDEANLTKQVGELITKNTELEASNKTLSDRITVLEGKLTSSTSTSGGEEVISGLTIKAEVKDEGTLQSNNSTLGEIKLTLSNNSGRDIEDLIVSDFVYFDTPTIANQSISVSGYGTWTIRTRTTDEMEIRGRLAKLANGEIRKVYIYVTSWGYIVGETTYLDTSSKDMTVVSWDYAS